MMKYAVFTLLLAMIGLSEAKLQNVTVTGFAVCNKYRMANVRVQLMEKDTLDPNDELATTHTDQQGYFKLTGEENEITSIAPYLIFNHNCKTSFKNGKSCTRATEYIIPKEFINNPKPYEMTYVTLDIFTSGEKEICD